MNRPLTFAIVGNHYQVEKSRCVTTILHALHSFGASVMMEETYAAFLRSRKINLDTVDSTFSGADFNADYMVSLGGDGTLLSAAALAAPKQVPIVGVNMGRLGFLADVQVDDFPTVLAAIGDGTAHVERHATICIETIGEPIQGIPFALNDIAVLKRDNAAMITIHASVDNEPLAVYQADGLIVSTPTGSTAYNLSNGGPIIAPSTHNLCLTPVAPHSLSARPIVISDDSVVELSVESRSHSFLVAIDGRSERLDEKTIIRIRKAPFPLTIVKRHNHHYFETLRQKLMWGADQRN